MSAFIEMNRCSLEVIGSLFIVYIGLVCTQINQWNPCPNIFTYQFDGSQWYGLLTLKNIAGPVLHVKVIFSLRGKPTSNYLGEIELLNRGHLANNNPIVFKVKFPSSANLPRITQIIVNNRLVCLGPPDQGVLVTVVQLEYSRKLSFVGTESLPLSSASSDVIKQSTTIDHDYNTLGLLNEICGQIHPIFATNQLLSSGDLVPRGSWPWLAAIYVSNLSSLSYHCGGNIISPRVVLSAAHCFKLRKKKYLPEDLIVFLGKYNLKNWSEDTVVVSCDEIFIHPGFDENLKSYDADIAVLLLKDHIRFNELIRPACLWSGSIDLEYLKGEQGIVVGWGHDQSHMLTATPKRARTTIVSNIDCLNSNDKFGILTSNRTFCAGNRDGTGPCTGDSGVGLMIFRSNRWMLRGIVSASLSSISTESSCNLHEYVIYADVAQFLDWIYAFLI